MKPFIEQWNIAYNIPPKNVLEIGSRDGNDAHELKMEFDIPDDKVYIVEPHPHCIDYTRSLHPTYPIYEMAVSSQDGTAKFNAVFNPDLGTLGMSSLMSRTDESFPENWIEVKTVTGKSLVQLIGEEEYDLVKIDVEGHTYEVLESFGDDITKIKMMHLEVEHYPFWKDQKLYDDVRALLERYGFHECYRFDYVYREGQVQSDVIWKR